jgi:hypothetical protein
LVHAIRKLVPQGSQIDVLTTVPNRYGSFIVDVPLLEELPGLTIQRFPLRRHQSGMFAQAMGFMTFARRTRKRVAGRSYDIVFATSGRLMTAALGAAIARQTNARLYLDIRDIFVENMSAATRPPLSWTIKPVFSAVEKWAVSRASKVNLVSRGFTEYFARRYPDKPFSFFTNGIDTDFLTFARLPDSRSERIRHNGLITVLYAGNVGEGQGLHEIIPGLAKSFESKARFKIIGDGGRKRELEQALRANSVTNVDLLPPMGRDKLREAYLAADVLFVHLNDYEAFKKVLPSKLFECAALGKPLWAGVSGFAADFVRAEISNAAVFSPCNVGEATRSFEQLKLENTPRADFIEKYSRTRISEEMAADILAVMHQKA